MKWIEATGLDQQVDLEDFAPESQVPVMMDPETYLALASPVSTDDGGSVWIDPARVNAIKQRLRNRLPLDPLSLEVDIDRGQIGDNDGLHRATAALELGLTSVPVILFGRSNQGEPYASEAQNPGFQARLQDWFEGPPGERYPQFLQRVRSECVNAPGFTQAEFLQQLHPARGISDGSRYPEFVVWLQDPSGHEREL